MSARDERPAGRVAVWAWTALELTPPVESDDPDGIELLLDATHDVDLGPIVERIAGWQAEALTLPVGARAAYWTTKADALDAVHGAGYMTWDPLDWDPLDVSERLRARAAAAAQTAALAEVSANTDQADGPLPAWVQLAEPSRRNDQWGPLIPLLEYAMATTLDSSNDGVLRRWAAVCRQHAAARAHCEVWGMDIDLMMPVPRTRIGEFKSRAMERRRSQRGSP